MIRLLYPFVFGLATGVLLYDTALERQQHQQHSGYVHLCAPTDAAGRALAAEMVSSAAGDSVHECEYR